MKRPLFFVGIVFALGEVMIRSCMDTEYHRAAVMGAVLLPVLVVCAYKTVLQGRTVFLYAMGRHGGSGNTAIGRRGMLFGGLGQRRMLFTGAVFVGSFGMGALWGWLSYLFSAPLPAGTEICGSFVVTAVSEGEDGCGLELKAGGQKYYAYVKCGDVFYEDAGDADIMGGLDKDGYYETKYEKDSEKHIHVGEGYRINAVVGDIAGPTNPGEFDFRSYCLGRGIRRSLKIESMTRDKSCDSKLRRGLARIRDRLSDSIYRLFPDRYAGILAAMLLGDRSGLDNDMRKLYQVNGIAHILAISSLHMAFFASVITYLLRLLGLKGRVRALLSIAGLFLYGMMTGFSEAAVRAFIMITAVFLAELFGRTADKPTSMVTALLVMMIVNPDSVVSSGFQMSYAAAAGLICSELVYSAIYENERFRSMKKFIRKRYKVFMMGLISSVTLNAFLLPLVIKGYYEVPLYSMAVNFIIIPLLFIAVAFGFAAAVLGLHELFMIPARIAAFPAEMVLRFYEWICRLFMKLPLARINTGAGRVYHYSVYIILLAVVVMFFGKRRRRKAKENGSADKIRKREKKYCIGYILTCFVLEAVFLISVSLTNGRRSFAVILDVGQGSASFVHTAEGVNIIYDGGSSSKKENGRKVIAPALKYFGISDIDVVFLSHSDEDHINGLIYLFEESELEGFEIERLCVSQMSLNDINLDGSENNIVNSDNNTVTDERLNRLISAAERIGCEVIYVSAGDVIEAEDVKMEVLYPFEDEGALNSNSGKICERTTNKNESSLVMRLTCHEKTILFPGDIGNESEEEIVKKEALLTDSDILICPHHGSKYSSSDVFIRTVSPETVIISCGRNNLYGHPAPEIIERYETEGVDIKRTDQDGAVVIDLE